MIDPGLLVTTHNAEDEDELKRIYGEDAVITRLGKYNLIHLDHPDPEEVERRLGEFDPDELYEDDCPLCQMLRIQGSNVVYPGEEME